MKEIIERKSNGDDIEELYSQLVSARRQRDIYFEEEKDILAKQMAME